MYSPPTGARDVTWLPARVREESRPMSDDSKKVDAYIAQAAPFARPILERIRRAFHEGCPDLQERIKWGAPSFEKDGIVGGMAAFKAHASFGFWRGAELEDPHGILKNKGTASFMAEKFTSISELPPHELLVDYVRRAAVLNATKKPVRPGAKPSPEVPPELAAALRKNTQARKTFEGLTPGHRREYIEWIAEAKRPETRERRLEKTIEWLLEGKSRNWKYT